MPGFYFFTTSPRMAAMLQLSSPMTSVRFASLFSIRTSKNQLSTTGNPKSLMKLNTSVVSMSRPPFHHAAMGSSVVVRRRPPTASTMSPPLVAKTLLSTITCMAASISAFVKPDLGSSMLRTTFLPVAFLKIKSRSSSHVFC